MSNEGITKVVKYILSECPNGIEDIDSEKLQIKLDFIDSKFYKPIIDIMNNSSKIQTSSDYKEDSKSPVKDNTD